MFCGFRERRYYVWGWDQGEFFIKVIFEMGFDELVDF